MCVGSQSVPTIVPKKNRKDKGMRGLQHTEYGFVKDDKKWKCYCTVPSIVQENGKKWRPVARGTTKREAREKIEIVIANKEKELEEAQKVKEEKQAVSKQANTLAEQIKSYAVIKQAEQHLKLSSIKDKKEIVKNLIEPYKLGKMEVDKIKRSDVSEWLRTIRKEKSENRCKKAYNLLTDYYSNYYCNTINVNYSNPAYGFKFSIAKSKADPMRIFDNDETALYLKACEEMGERGDILQFILYTYCREGEADTLTWSDWNQGDLIHIHKTWSKDDNDKYFVDSRPKTKDSDRFIHLPSQVVALLNVRYADVEGTEYGKPSSWIFPAVKDKTKPLSESTTMNWHKEALERAGLSLDMRVHDLRHSGISFNIRNSQVDCLSALSKQAGHSSRAITESIYEHVLDSQHKELAEISSQIYENICPW